VFYGFTWIAARCARDPQVSHQTPAPLHGSQIQKSRLDVLSAVRCPVEVARSPTCGEVP